VEPVTLLSLETTIMLLLDSFLSCSVTIEKTLLT